MFTLKKLCKSDIVDDIVDDIIRDSHDNVIGIVCHSDIGLAVNIQSGVADVGKQLNDVLLSRISQLPKSDGFTSEQVDKVSDLTELVNFEQTRWCQFPSDKKAFMEKLIAQRDKRLAEIADKKKAADEKAKFIQSCKKLGLDTSQYETEM